jgi:hypothetical protein
MKTLTLDSGCPCIRGQDSLPQAPLRHRLLDSPTVARTFAVRGEPVRWKNKISNLGGVMIYEVRRNMEAYVSAMAHALLGYATVADFDAIQTWDDFPKFMQPDKSGNAKEVICPPDAMPPAPQNCSM